MLLGLLGLISPFSLGASYRPLVLFLQKMEDKPRIDILHVWHPLKMSVRYKFNLRQYFELRDSMDQFYAIASSEETLLFRGRYVAVLHENRARFMKSVKVDCLKAKVLLIDFGEVYIYRFLQGHPGESHV